jgi:zinc transporter ZupT
MVNLMFQVIFVATFCGGLIGALIGEPLLMGSCLMSALGCMMFIMFREEE